MTDKYTQALALLDEYGAIKDRCHATLTPAMDQLLEYLLANWPATEVTHADVDACRTMMYTVPLDQLDADIRARPSLIIDAVWPVAVFKLSLLRYGITADPTKLKHLDQFHKQFGMMIIDASGTRQHKESL